MRHAIVIGNIVVNVVMADEPTGRDKGWIQSEDADIGWIYDGERFIPQTVVIDTHSIVARAKRDLLLSESDIQVYPDRWARMSPERQTAWSDYRQALRDISLQSGFPREIVWPQIPE